MTEHKQAPVKIFKMHPDVPTPAYQTQGSAAFDIAAFFSHIEEPTVSILSEDNRKTQMPFRTNPEGKRQLSIPPGFRMLVPTGIKMDIEKEFFVDIRNRSSVAVKQGTFLINATGVIDSDYVDELFVPLYNSSARSFVIEEGDRIAQAIVLPKVMSFVYLTVTEPQKKTDREGGFGSTGVQ